MVTCVVTSKIAKLVQFYVHYQRYSGLVVFLIKENNPSEVNDKYHFDGNLVITPKVK